MGWIICVNYIFMTFSWVILLRALLSCGYLRSEIGHPRLQETYTGHEKTHGQNNFFWPFLTKTKQEWPLTGHFQGKFLLGALHFGCQTLEPKMVGFVGSACAQATPMEKVWTAMFTKTKVNQFRNEWKLVSGLTFGNFFAFLPKNAPRWKNGLLTFSGRGIGNLGLCSYL